MRSNGRGFSLTELLVATALLATATGGGLAAFSRAHAAWREASVLQQLHERAQYVFATLEPELQMAGFFSSGITPPVLDGAAIPESALRCGSSLVRRLDLPLEIASTWPLSCDARGGGAIGGSDVLTIRRASVRLAVAPEPGRAQWFSNATDPGRNQLFWLGEAPWQPAMAAAGEELRELILRVYYVARTADGDAAMPALRMKSLTSIAGVPAFIDTEVMNGIEQLRIEVLPSAAAPRTVRVQLRVRADTPGLRAGIAARTLQVDRQFTLRNSPG